MESQPQRIWIYATPTKHKETHFKNGEDPIRPEDIGAISLEDLKKFMQDQKYVALPDIQQIVSDMLQNGDYATNKDIEKAITESELISRSSPSNPVYTARALPPGAPTDGLAVFLADSLNEKENRWEDLSGNGNHAFKPEWAGMPTVVKIIDKNLSFNVTSFNGDDGLIFPDSLIIESEFTIIVGDQYSGSSRTRTVESSIQGKNWLIGKVGRQNAAYHGRYLHSQPIKEGFFELNAILQYPEGSESYLNMDKRFFSSSSGNSPEQIGLNKGGAFNSRSQGSDVYMAFVVIYLRKLEPYEMKIWQNWASATYGIGQ